jgi:pullulanase/glycogen debranching enzyme
MLLTALCALHGLTRAAVPATTLADCDGPFQTTLQPAATALDARAVWTDARTIEWPGQQAGGTFRLYHAAGAGIVARAGAPVTGADGAVALRSSDAIVKHEGFRYLGPGLQFSVNAPVDTLRALHREQLVVVREDAAGRALDATRIQSAGALDKLYAAAVEAPDLGVTATDTGATFKLWAPTAQAVAVCLYDSGSSHARAIAPMQRDDASGIWRAAHSGDISGGYYSYLVDVVAGDAGLVRNLVTDPYSISLSTDSKRSYIADLAAPGLQPPGWNAMRAPQTVRGLTDMVVYELHVRDFSINDASVPVAHRGKYLAFTDTGSNGMRHLAALARAGLTDIHLLPVFDFGSVPEQGCVTPHPAGAADSESQQALVTASADKDCFNWGYDPFHYSAPEGSYALDAADGKRRIIELRALVQSLHKLGLRVGMDVVYNHTYRAGQHERAVLDRIVPGYYHRLDASGKIAQSTCCDNTATENAMMGKLMIDSVVLWATQYKIDSFRFDLMGHQPRAVMEQLQARVDAAAGHPVQLIGEGWNFGEVADGARFVQASQLSLGGSGIGSFSDRGRDAVRGGGAGDSGAALIEHKGFINGGISGAAADMVKLGLAGSLRTYSLQTADGKDRPLWTIYYGKEPAPYAVLPGEAVNYVENHDNQTLYDINVLKLPRATSTAERARVQMLGAAIVAFSQGVAYYHAGIDTLRSKSLDRNSFNSGDWFNRLDWTYRTNYFGTGLPPAADNGKDYALLKPLLADAHLRPAPADIAFARDVFRDLLAVRASSTLFRMRTAADVQQRLHFMDSPAAMIAARLDGEGYAGAGFKSVCYFVNVDTVAHTVAGQTGRRYRLHPAQKADGRVKQARFESGVFTIPPRTAVVFVE